MRTKQNLKTKLIRNPFVVFKSACLGRNNKKNMKQQKEKERREQIRKLKKKVSQAVSKGFPGCSAEFSGRGGSMAPRVRTLSFRVHHDQKNQFISNVIWLNPEYDGNITVGDIIAMIKESNN